MFNIQIENFMYQYFHNNLPINLNDIFRRNCDIHELNTRHRRDPCTSNRHTALASKSCIHLETKFWHTIPTEIKDSNNLKCFNRKIKILRVRLY